MIAQCPLYRRLSEAGIVFCPEGDDPVERNNQHHFGQPQRRVSSFLTALEVAFEVIVFIAAVALIRAYWLY
jgi:hypothetical protein